MSLKKHIMIIDDDQRFLEQFEEMLKMSGYKTQQFVDGDTALLSLAVNKQLPDIIVLDLKIDGKSGFEIAEILQNNPMTKDIPVIVVSAFYSDDTFEGLKKNFGVKYCLTKPIKPIEVISKIETLLKGTS